MKINAPKEKYVFIELNKSDMKTLGLSYADMDYSDEETRKTIYSVLRQAKESLGQNFELSDTKSVEALPRDDGGCLLFFTIGEKLKRYRLKKQTSELCYFFKSIDDLIDFSSSLKRSEMENISACLWLSGEEYLLKLKGKFRHSLISRLGEYAYPMKAVGIHDRDERCVIAENALEILGGGIPE